jgi:NSS family neurotransmitter:Na+ symporter
MSSDTSMHGFWKSRWLFILAATGSAVGLGNIWKFPYITGENGGGAFVLVYLLCICIIGIPVMIAEVSLGRMGRQSPINTMKALAQKAGANPFWASIGWMGAIAGFLILSFYSVIAGWALSYTVEMASGSFVAISAADSGKIFGNLLGDPTQLTIWHTVFMIFTMVIVARGVNAGLEKAIKVLMPALFILLFILFGYALSSSGFSQGFDFMFNFDFSKLSSESVIIALGHAFFTLSLGLGAIMAYGAYMPKNTSVAKTVVIVAFLDTAVAIMAGLAIFPIVFANGLEPSAGPGLLFQTLPIAFGQMSAGVIFGTMFFVLVSFAAWTSAISLAEPIVAWMVEKYKMGRAVSALIIGICAWLLGLATVFSFNIWSEVKLFDKTIFDLLDFATTNVMLPLGGLLIALFASWTMSKTTMMKEVGINNPTVFKAWHFTLRFLAPVAIIAVLVNGLI